MKNNLKNLEDNISKYKKVKTIFFLQYILCNPRDFPGGSEDKESTCNAGDLSLSPGSERYPGEGYGNPPQYSCLGNPMDRGAWWATVHGVAKSQLGLWSLGSQKSGTQLSN